MHEGYVAAGKKESGILDNLKDQLALARKLHGVYDNRPDIGSFVGAMRGTKHEVHYTKERIEEDKAYVKETRAKIDESNSSSGRAELNRIEGGFQLSEIMQAMIVDRLNKKWFKELKAVMTSDYDDLTVGIDAVMKHEKGGYLGAAFDFTVTNQDKKIYEKLNREWDKNTKDGKIPTVKYFEDPDTKEKGKLLVPKFIIGASKKDVEDLAHAYLSDNTEVLENHPFKFVMLLQIEEQLQTVLDYYDTNKDDISLSFARTHYERIQTLIRNMRNEIHVDEKMHQVDLYEYTKSSVALDMMRRFRIMRGRKD
jgi:hypothetical protein